MVFMVSLMSQLQLQYVSSACMSSTLISDIVLYIKVSSTTQRVTPMLTPTTTCEYG